MTRRRILVAAAIAWVAWTPAAIAQRPEVPPIQLGNVAEKLGVKTVPNSPRELELGTSATAMLTDPAKLAPYGIKNMHEGARVTITCVGPNAVRVEADELEPVEQKAAVVLKVGADGALTATERKPPPKP